MFNKLAPRIKTLWLAALRSGDYTQCVAKMRVTKRATPETRETYGEGYCCLGVLNDIALKEGEIDTFVVNSRNQSPTMHVRDWSHLDVHAQSHLMRLNDGRPNSNTPQKPLDNTERKNFNEIAEWIETNL